MLKMCYASSPQLNFVVEWQHMNVDAKSHDQQRSLLEKILEHYQF